MGRKPHSPSLWMASVYLIETTISFRRNNLSTPVLVNNFYGDAVFDFTFDVVYVLGSFWPWA